jgi:small subunit ribosomal protein S27e
MPLKKKKPESKFLEISCPRCKERQVIFGKSSTNIKCKSCNLLLTKTTGGKTKVKAPVKEIL